ncbi:polyprenyl synthetase family protein [Aureimonas sp. Leaf454]|uniref:polyprenyl synthetase family protein n=1 Tax=Aureimonas sp. Leaf454 TaxID=1736381 RepID=UPI0009EC68D9|nr:polyprenyl synthetase family protein [Aureimonas sp. Leaf454]
MAGRNTDDDGSRSFGTPLLRASGHAPGRLDAYRERIDERLAALIPAVLPGHDALGEAFADSLLAPGKRLRPLMTVIAAEDLGGRTAPAIDAGCAVEMVHAASLVLDDLPCMDDAALRRGRPAIHVRHGEDLAVLVSIAALAGAYQVVANLDEISAEARSDCVAILSHAVGVAGLVGGQFEDLRRGRTARPVAEIAAANGLKTGVLFSAAVEIGAVTAGADETARATLRHFARELGHAFQLLDDLLDGASDPLLIGKDIGKDEGKSTIVRMVGVASARRRMERHLEAAGAALEDLFGRGSRLQLVVDAIFADRLPLIADLEDEKPIGQEIGAR